MRVKANNRSVMKPQRPSRNKRDLDVPLCRMGMGLSVLGAVASAAGLAACCWNTERGIGTRAVLLLASGMIMLISGACVWYSAGKSRRNRKRTPNTSNIEND